MTKAKVAGLFLLMIGNSFIHGRREITFPGYSHNTIGDIPIVEFFDDQYWQNRGKDYAYSMVSMDGAMAMFNYGDL